MTDEQRNLVEGVAKAAGYTAITYPNGGRTVILLERVPGHDTILEPTEKLSDAWACWRKFAPTLSANMHDSVVKQIIERQPFNGLSEKAFACILCEAIIAADEELNPEPPKPKTAEEWAEVLAAECLKRLAYTQDGIECVESQAASIVQQARDQTKQECLSKVCQTVPWLHQENKKVDRNSWIHGVNEAREFFHRLINELGEEPSDD